MASWAGKPHIKGSTETMRMLLLSFSMIGLSFTWGIEMTYCTPYLLQLGLTKSRTSLVWVAGPLSGLVMQPIVGVIADRSTSRYGRRRPFMVGGSIVVGLCLLVLGWTKEIVGVFIEDEEWGKTCTVVVAVSSIYAIDFAINAVQSCCRSLVVDTLPIPKQQLGSAYASRMGSVGHLLSYAVGTLDLVTIFGPSLGNTQFKKLTLIAALSLISSVSVTSWAVTERILLPSALNTSAQDGILTIIRQIINTTLTLPPRIQAICNIQLWSWIGWFPFLFYSTTFVGEIYYRYEAPHPTSQSKDALGDIGRIGSLALVVFSLITALGAFILPLLIQSPDSEDESFTPRPPAAIANIASAVRKYRPDLLTSWIWGHLLFAGAMLLTPFAHSFRVATFLVALCGFPWAIIGWAPNAYMGIEVNRLSSTSVPYRHLSTSSDIELASPRSSRAPTPAPLENGVMVDNGGTSGTGELSGLYFGIMNIYNTIPQFIATFISMIVFGVLEPGKSPELAGGDEVVEKRSGPNAISVCLFIGALCSVGAAIATKRLKTLM